MCDELEFLDHALSYLSDRMIFIQNKLKIMNFDDIEYEKLVDRFFEIVDKSKKIVDRLRVLIFNKDKK